MKTLCDHEHWLAVDFETTGTRPRRLSEVGVARMVGRTLCDSRRGALQCEHEEEVWTWLSPLVWHAEVFIAHNVSFDKASLMQLCQRRWKRLPSTPWVCSMRLAKEILGIEPAGLRHVCERLEIPLEHHNPQSDAAASAAIAVAAVSHVLKGVAP